MDYADDQPPSPAVFFCPHSDYLRQYDASSPVKYSRDSALLYVDYPL